MSENRKRGKLWLLYGVVALFFCALTIGTWHAISPSSSPLNFMSRAKTWPAVPRRVRPSTLDPSLFKGRIAEGYRIAKERAELLEQMPCYCGCYMTHGHQNSLDCFRDHHGETCEMCVSIAIRAEELAKRGYSVEDIKTLVDQEFAPLQPATP